MKHKNIPIFIPHLGCEMQCSFCNQRHITGQIKQPTTEDIEDIISSSIKYLEENHTREDMAEVQIAFFGGSFTAIDRDLMISYLSTANDFLLRFGLGGIRISTRPDFIDDEIIRILQEYNVNSIELGVQSLDDEVLRYNRRNHSYEDAVRAVGLIKEAKIELGLQMMIGLYKDTEEKLFETAKKIIQFKPDNVRIYPTVILKHTYLEELYMQKKYIPISLEKAVELSSRVMRMFIEEKIDILKVGLHSSKSVEEEMVGGLYHPSFRELCDSKIYRSILEEGFKNLSKGRYFVYVATSNLAKAVGYKKQNDSYFYKNGYRINFSTDDRLKDYEVKIEDYKMF